MEEVLVLPGRRGGGNSGGAPTTRSREMPRDFTGRGGRPALCIAVIVAVLVAFAPAASAHAVLLRTHPAPQTTVPQAPTDVRLEFSEPVEAAFGAIRVFDVDGRRVDHGSIRSQQGRRDALIAVPHLKD